jgi:hypothetical protein
MLLLWAHVSLYLAVNIVLVAINLLITPGTLWFLYPLWGWELVVAAHIGITWPGRSWLLPHALVSLWLSAGLIGIDLATGGPFWSPWPVWALMSLLAVHALHAADKVDDFGAHALLTLFIGLELVGAGIVADAARGDLALAFGYGLVALFVRGLYRFGHPTLLQAHVAAFVGINALLALDARSEGSWWFVYPLAAWSVLLAAHAAISRPGRRDDAGTRERTMLSALAQNDRPTAEGARDRRRVRLAGFRPHLVAFSIGLVILAIIALLAPGGGWWLVWPVSVWLVLLAAHAGMLAIPGYPALGLSLLGGGAVISWLFGLDMQTGPATWWYWPAAAWVVLTIVAVPLSVDLLGMATSDER